MIITENILPSLFKWNVYETYGEITEFLDELQRETDRTQKAAKAYARKAGALRVMARSGGIYDREAAAILVLADRQPKIPGFVRDTTAPEVDHRGRKYHYWKPKDSKKHNPLVDFNTPHAGPTLAKHLGFSGFKIIGGKTFSWMIVNTCGEYFVLVPGEKVEHDELAPVRASEFLELLED